jgi:FkbM family methyltransferase
MFMRKSLPNPVKIEMVRLYHCLLLVSLCKNWPAAILERLKMNKRETPLPLRLRNGLNVSVEPGSLDVQVLAEIFGEREYTPNFYRRSYQEARVIVDIGANKGMFTLFAATTFPNAGVYAYEPDPLLFAELQRHIARNRFDARCRLHNCAVWSRQRSVTFAPAHRMNRGGGAVVERKEATGAIEVQALALKDILRELQMVDFMKMDIEGAEYEVILGTSAEDLRVVKFLALEHHPSPVHGVDEIIRHLQGAGFSVCRGSRGRMLYAWQEGWNG